MAKGRRIERLGFEVKAEIFKTNVRAVRKHIDITDVEFGRLLGVTGGAVRMWESGQSTPEDERVVDILKLAHERDIPITDRFLLTGEGEGPEWREDNFRRHKPRPQSRRYEGANGAAVAVSETIPIRAALDNGDGSITISGEIERAATPRNLVGREGAYGLFVPNDDMAPALRYGDIAWVDTMLPPARDSEVVVEGPDNTATIGTLVAYGKNLITIEVLQPERRRIELSRSGARVHRIAGKEARR